MTHGVPCPYLTAVPPDPVASESSRERSRPNKTAASKPSVGRSSGPPKTTTTSTWLPIANPPAEPEQNHLPNLELELLHNFTTNTYSTLAADSGVCDFWRLTVVQVGFQCDFIMLSVLALSALHLACHRPSERDFYTSHGILFHQRALRSATRLMAAPTGVDNLSDLLGHFYV